MPDSQWLAPLVDIIKRHELDPDSAAICCVAPR
jgi:hypothetical protein